MSIKKVTIILVGLVVLLVLFVYSCQNYLNDSRANAYLELFKYMILGIDENFLNDQVDYIAVDLTNILHEQPDNVQAQIENYAKEYGFTLLWDDMDGLVKSGHIITDDYGFPEHFEKGRLVSFSDIRLDNTTLITDVLIWHGNLGAFGGEYTVIKTHGKWIVEQPETTWIS